MANIPNLFKSDLDLRGIRWYYENFLVRLQTANRHQRIIELCRQIRRFASAARLHRERELLFTYVWEKLAYGDLGDFESMWRLRRAWERAAFGRVSLHARQLPTWMQVDGESAKDRFAA